MLLRWWLRVTILDAKLAGSSTPLCESRLDMFGDHAVSCNRNSPGVRHNAVQESLHNSLISNGITCIPEVAFRGKDTLADLRLPTFASAGPIAVDVTIRHPTCLWTDILVPQATAVVRYHEAAKLKKYPELCKAAGCTFVPLGFSTCGGTSLPGGGGVPGHRHRTRGPKQVR